MVGQVLRCGLTGDNIGRSRFSKALDLMATQVGLTLEFTPFDTAGQASFDLAAHVERLRAGGYDGITVTHPHKVRADALADCARSYPGQLGASNLLRFDAGGIHAFNTDYDGFIAAWRHRFGTLPPGNVAVAGAGGVARAVIAALIELGAATVVVWDTDPARADLLARQLDPGGAVVRGIAIASAAAAIGRADGVVNATPMGMREHPGCAFDPETLPGRRWAFDAVYTPLATDFLVAAKRCGLDCLSGFELFRHMAVASFAAYTRNRFGMPDPDQLNDLAEGL